MQALCDAHDMAIRNQKLTSDQYTSFLLGLSQAREEAGTWLSEAKDSNNTVSETVMIEYVRNIKFPDCNLQQHAALMKMEELL